MATAEAMQTGNGTATATSVDSAGSANPAPNADGQSSSQSIPPTAATTVEYKFEKVDGVDESFDKEITEIAKDLGLTQEQAAKYRAKEIELAKANDASMSEADKADKAAYEQKQAQQRAEWEKENRAHAEFGGDKYDETTTRIGKLIAEFGADNFAKDVEQVPDILNKPSFRAFLAKIAYAHGEGSFVKGEQAKSQTTARDLFPSSKTD